MSELKVTTLKHADSAVDSIVMASDGTLAFGAAVTDSAGVAVKGGVPAQAWVNFNGTGTVAIRRAFNVSSITDTAVGYFRVNFTTAMPDANYSVLTGGAGAVDNKGVMQVQSSSVITTSVIIQSGVTGGYNSQDNPYVFCAIFS